MTEKEPSLGFSTIAIHGRRRLEAHEPPMLVEPV